MSAETFRRPTTKWCTDTTIRLLQIATREQGMVVEQPDGKVQPLLEAGEAKLLLDAAAALDAYGQRLEAAKRR